ncbi:MAG: hypothetical protein HDT18_10470 [Oscillibacter sp.]|nr:hypothetical protein [Oscillibacter sp.]
MEKKREGRRTLSDRVFRPLACGAWTLCALLTALASAAAYPAARDASAIGWLFAGALTLFLVTGGGSVYLIRLICQRYLAPVTEAVEIVSQAAGGDHSAPLTGIPRTSEEASALLDAVGELGKRSSDCMLELENTLRRMADGDFTVSLPCGRASECGGACGALDGMSQKLRGGIGAVRTALDQLAGQLDELERDAGRLSGIGQERRQERDQLSQALDRLGKRLDSRAEDAQAVSGGADELCRRLDAYGQRVEALIQAVDRISDCAVEAGKIVKVMESTAFQCSVLARTAYMEAASAGVNGKGFAVVASELRVLASRSAQSAQDAAVIMGEMVQTIREGSVLASEASRELRSVAGGGQELCGLAARAEAETRETKEMRDASRQAVRLTAAAEEDQLLASQAAVSARILRDRASRLREALRVFRLN